MKPISKWKSEIADCVRNGESVADIAARTGLSVEAVRVVLRQAMGREPVVRTAPFPFPTRNPCLFDPVAAELFKGDNWTDERKPYGV